MPQRTKPHWGWRIALLAVPLGGWAVALLPELPRLSDDLARRLQFQTECECLLFGPMPPPDPPTYMVEVDL